MTVVMVLWFCVCSSLSSCLLEIHTKIFTFEINKGFDGPVDGDRAVVTQDGPRVPDGYMEVH